MTIGIYRYDWSWGTSAMTRKPTKTEAKIIMWIEIVFCGNGECHHFFMTALSLMTIAKKINVQHPLKHLCRWSTHVDMHCYHKQAVTGIMSFSNTDSKPSSHFLTCTVFLYEGYCFHWLTNTTSLSHYILCTFCRFRKSFDALHVKWNINLYLISS